MMKRRIKRVKKNESRYLVSNWNGNEVLDLPGEKMLLRDFAAII